MVTTKDIFDAPLSTEFVTIGYEVCAVQDRNTHLGCSINDLIGDDLHWSDQARFLEHISTLCTDLIEHGDISPHDGRALRETALLSGVGTNSLEEVLLDLPEFQPEVLRVAQLHRATWDIEETLSGLDVDRDGVRDDIAAFIAAWPISPGRRLAAMGVARAMQALMTAPGFDVMTIDNAYDLAQEIDFRCACLASISGMAGAQFMATLIRSSTCNTPCRRERYEGMFRALSGTAFDAIPQPKFRRSLGLAFGDSLTAGSAPEVG